jgi:Uma2 family endonuclease
MSAVRQPRALLTPEEYLRLEREAEFKSEYVNGHVYAMAGAKVNHNQIAANLTGMLWSQLRGRPCRIFGSDMKVHIEKANAFRYPDVSGLCGPMVFHDTVEDAYCNPSVIIEVLSEATESLDRGEKFTLYRLLGTLLEYVLVHQGRVEVEVFTRDTEGRWTSIIYNEPADSFSLPSIDGTLKLAEIYDRFRSHTLWR